MFRFCLFHKRRFFISAVLVYDLHGLFCKRISLRHDLFDEDAIILKNMAREVSLRSKVSSHSVTVSYPKMPYLGIWHWPHTDAPYVCIEPWSSLPSRQDVVEELSCKSDLVQLESGCVYDNTWTITIGGE